MLVCWFFFQSRLAIKCFEEVTEVFHVVGAKDATFLFQFSEVVKAVLVDVYTLTYIIL